MVVGYFYFLEHGSGYKERGGRNDSLPSQIETPPSLSGLHAFIGDYLYNKSRKRRQVVKRKGHELSRVLKFTWLLTTCCLLSIETMCKNRKGAGNDP